MIKYKIKGKTTTNLEENNNNLKAKLLIKE